MKTLPLLAITLLALGGCLRGGSETLHLPAMQPPLGIPQQLDYAGEKYQLQQWNGQNAEYYRSGEQGFAWQKLLTLTLAAQGEDLAQFAAVMEKELTRENTLHDVQQHDNHVQITSLYPPQIGHPHFSGYESNLKRYQRLPCGFSGLQYAEQHPADADGKRLFADLQAAQPAFQQQAAAILVGISCPGDKKQP